MSEPSNVRPVDPAREGDDDDRQQRYLAAVWGKPNTLAMVASVMAVADEEQAGLRAEVERLRGVVSALDSHERCTWHDRLDALVADLRGLVDELPNLTEGPDRIGTAKWSEHDREVYSLAIEEAQQVVRAVLDKHAGEQAQGGEGS
jgi:hypothetical protein